HAALPLSRVHGATDIKVEPGEVGALAGRLGRARLRCLLLQLDLVASRLGQRNDLLYVEQDSILETVRLQANAPDVEIALIEPHHGRGYLRREVGRYEHDANILRELLL